MTTEGVVILLAIPGAFLAVAGAVLVAHRRGWVGDDQMAYLRLPAKWLSYLVWTFLGVSFLTGTLSILLSWRPEAKLEALLLSPFYWAIWFSPIIASGLLLRKLAKTAGVAGRPSDRREVRTRS